MHRLLARQIKRNLGKDFSFDTLDEKIVDLLKDVSQVYTDSDTERKFLENTISVNTEELNTLLRERSSLLESRTQENQDVINLLHQYKNAIDAALIVSATDINGIIKYANENFCRTSGFSKEELIGNSHSILKDSSNDENLYKNIWKTIKNKEIWNGTFSNIKKNGEKYYINMSVVPLLDRDKEIKEFISLSEDVTQQVIYEKELKAERERISTILNSQENIVVIVHEKNGIVDANRRFFETFDFVDLEDYKANVENISSLFEQDNEYFDKKLTESLWFEQFFQKKDTLHKIIRIDKKNQEQIFSVHCREAILNGDIHYLCTFIDITELENARQKAEIAQKAKSTFLANMSHEIRTPLNAIIGFSDILCESNINAEEKENAKIISRSAKSLLGIINDVLDISKIESGKLDIVEEPFVFEMFTENIVELFSVATREKKIRFIYNPDPFLPYSLIFDSTRLQQVISNLLSNAIKFTPKNGEVIFDIKLLEKNNNSVKIRFSIKDNGIGMTQEQQKIIFNPFSQADDGISREYGGTGLGLAICSDIIKIMNSRIELDSEINKGSEFSFILDFKVDKFENTRKKLDSEYTFLLHCSDGNNDRLRLNIENHINKLGKVKDYDLTNKIGNILFCCGCSRLESIVEEFKRNNEKSLVIYIGDKAFLNDSKIKNHIDNYLELPIYGSKLFNIISEKLKLNSIVVNKPETHNQTFEGKVLVAEDNPNNQKLIEILLKKLGVDPVIVSNGQEVVSAYKKDKYDLILMDINMPIMDGISATKEIRQIESKYTPISIVALTANSIVGDKEKYLTQGMDDYLSKPIEFNKLIDILKKYLEKDEFNSLKNRLTVKKISESLGFPEELSSILLNSFKSNILDDLEEFDTNIKNNETDKIKQKAYYIKNSCLNVNLLTAVNILEKFEDESFKDEKKMLEEFSKLNKIILIACNL
uniref:ATP-binding protein n=1 Tax=Aliarcobacter sp. TaxID=2321116 RepID=UPI0040475083